MYNKKMNFNNKILNDLISKDFKTSKLASEKLINDNNFEAYKELVEKSEFIFDFIKEKINKNLSNAINEKNFSNLFNFIKIYSDDFSEFILNGLLKFANDELTDILLDKLENGTDDEKCHATKYFSNILDPLCIETIKSNLTSDNETLKLLSAQALRAHGRTDELEIAKINLRNNDEKTCHNAFQFILNYNDKNSFIDLFKFIETSKYKTNYCQDILYMIGLLEIKEEYGESYSDYIFNELIDGIPDILILNEFLVYELFNYISFLLNSPLNSIKALLILKAKNKFTLILSDNSYTFDTDKNTKNLINDISKSFSSKNNGFYDTCINYLEGNFKNNTYMPETLDVIKEENAKQYCDKITKLITNTQDTPLICKCGEILKDFNALYAINKEEIKNKLKTEMAKQLFDSYFS